MKKKAGTVLHILATWLYMAFVGLIIVLVLEIWKGFEIDYFIENPGISFGGAKEIALYAVGVVILARIADVYAGRFDPRVKRGARGWPYHE